jgi:hypothetical protein
VQQRLDEGFSIPACQSPHFMLLDGPYSSIVGTGNHELRDRSSFETGRIFNATLLLWIEPGFDPLDFLKLPWLRL